jgi:hypothetical protein
MPLLAVTAAKIKKLKQKAIGNNNKIKVNNKTKNKLKLKIKTIINLIKQLFLTKTIFLYYNKV